jgi:penicillin-insensitive murein DD-endopeptidase
VLVCAEQIVEIKPIIRRNYPRPVRSPTPESLLILRMKRFILLTSCTVLLLAGTIYWGNGIFIAFESPTPSVSVGTPSDGSIHHSKRLPSSGVNFSTYSRFGSLIGRTCVHDRVRATVLDAYSRVEKVCPTTTFIFGEAGWPSGGRFWPHKTHENGLSVDFMVPVKTRDFTPTTLSTSIFNRFGYDEEFDSTGRSASYVIDFDAMAAHLHALRESASVHGLEIQVVIFDTSLQRILFARPTGSDLSKIMRFSTKPAWVRHDEHYHIDFLPRD